MTSDRLAQAVREQVTLGRLLPLGGPADSLWITEQAAAQVLRTVAAGVPEVRLGTLRVGLDPLAVEAAFETSADRPLPVIADLLRTALWQAAHDRLGLRVAAIDLTVTGLLDNDQAPAPAPPPPEPAPAPPGPDPVSEPGSVPGLARVTSRLGGAGADAYFQIAVAAGHRVLDVARAAGEIAAPRAVLVTDVE